MGVEIFALTELFLSPWELLRKKGEVQLDILFPHTIKHALDFHHGLGLDSPPSSQLLLR